MSEHESLMAMVQKDKYIFIWHVWIPLTKVVLNALYMIIYIRERKTFFFENDNIFLIFSLVE